MKTEDETMPTKPVQDNYFSRGKVKSNDLRKRTFEMKEKFEAAMMLKKGSKTLTGRYLIAIEQAAEICDTLHQRAMKEEREKLINKIQIAKTYYQGIGRYNYSAGLEKAIYLIAKKDIVL